MLKNIHVLATGGTIAGKGAESTSNNYGVGDVDVAMLLTDLPELQAIANLSGEQPINVGGADVSLNDWVQLAGRANQLLQQNNIDGLVVTHGTDTLEETAYFLHLTLKSHKPVVVVGAMRPSTSLSADGPLNLYEAVQVAASDSAVGMGVLVVLNGTIFSAADIAKMDTQAINAFKSVSNGPLGYVSRNHVEFQTQSLKPHTVKTPFRVDETTALPQVAIIYEYIGNDGWLLKQLINSEIQGVVLAGVGEGNLTPASRAYLPRLREQGVLIVRSSRTGHGVVGYHDWMQLDDSLGLIPAHRLNPQKARILLMLALTQTRDIETIRRYFKMY
ncbi:MAG: asparaginase [Chloroflexota bacterium]